MVDAAVADLTKLVANLRYAHQNIKLSPRPSWTRPLTLCWL